MLQLTERNFFGDSHYSVINIFSFAKRNLPYYKNTIVDCTPCALLNYRHLRISEHLNIPAITRLDCTLIQQRYIHDSPSPAVIHCRVWITKGGLPPPLVASSLRATTFPSNHDLERRRHHREKVSILSLCPVSPLLALENFPSCIQFTQEQSECTIS